MNKKHGFTISELLMSIAIISIVSAMGMTIAKRGTEDAYKNYFAIGTMNLYNALAQIETGNVIIRVDPATNRLEEATQLVHSDPANPDSPMIVVKVQNSQNSVERVMKDQTLVTNRLRYLFNEETPVINDAELTPCTTFKGNRCTINAENGIRYEVIVVSHFQDPNHTFPIAMSVPAPRTRQNPDGRLWTNFIYIRGGYFAKLSEENRIDELGNSGGGMLVPLASGDDELINMQPLDYDRARFVSLQDRQDLLTAYIDDGTVGRHVPRYNADGSINHYDFMPIRYGTFRDAMCSILNNNIAMTSDFTVDGKTIVDCHNPGPAVHLSLDNSGNQIVNRDAAGNIIGTAPLSGVIKFASPRKLK